MNLLNLLPLASTSDRSSMNHAHELALFQPANLFRWRSWDPVDCAKLSGRVRVL